MGFIPLSSIINLYVSTRGRRIYALREVKRRAARRGLTDLVARIDQALEHEQHAAELEGRWRAGQAGKTTLPRDIDPRVDRTLQVIDQMLAVCADDSNPEVARYASELASLLFPNSVTAHIQLPYIDQLAANDYVLGILEAGEREAWVDRLGLRIYVQRLRTFNDAFRDALLARDAAPSLDFAEVRAANDQAQQNYLAITARIGGLYCDHADAEIRTDLLAPIIEQNEALRAYRRRRRRPVDIDADTGEPLDDDAGDISDGDAAEATAAATDGNEPADE